MSDEFRELLAAARAYFNDYCVDEADGLFAGVVDGVTEQRDAARRLRDAIIAAERATASATPRETPSHE